MNMKRIIKYFVIWLFIVWYAESSEGNNYFEKTNIGLIRSF